MLSKDAETMFPASLAQYYLFLEKNRLVLNFWERSIEGWSSEGEAEAMDQTKSNVESEAHRRINQPISFSLTNSQKWRCFKKSNFSNGYCWKDFGRNKLLINLIFDL